MTTTSPHTTGRQHLAQLGGVARIKARRLASGMLACVALVAMIVVAAVLQPGILSVTGLTMMLTAAVPLVLASLAQMMIMAVGDIDLGVGGLVGLVTVLAATWLSDSPLLGVVALVGVVGTYAALACLIELRRVPSIIITLGMSFVWLGIGLVILPTPGGAVPEWVAAVGSWRPTGVPGPLVIIVAATLVAYLITQRTTFGVRMRALGSDVKTLQRAGWSALTTRTVTYAIAGVFIIVAGLLLASQTRTGDVNTANNYMLMTIAAVILGGGTFAGGQAVAWGTAMGATTLALIGVLLSLLGLSSNLQSGAQGLIVLVALAGRVLTERMTR